MTDKEQIIINGVDVSGCEFLTKTVHCKAQMSIMGTDTNKCRCFPNCYYKQLQRRIAECEELKAYAQAQENQRETYYKEFLKLSQENEELKRRIKELLHDCNSCNFHKYKQAIEPFQDEYFKGLDTKQIAELAKKSIRLTTENRKLENKLSDIAGICSQILDGEDYVRRIAKTILDIID